MSKNTQKKQTAVQFLRKMDSMVNIMEGIAQKTRETENALLEEVGPDIFDMNSMLDVNVQDEEDQPMLSINKPRELTDGDKAQIVEEFANVLKKMPGDVIDFSDIGPIGTVIQTKLGFAQTLDGFLKDLISGAADSQNSQSFAKGAEVAGVQDANQVSATDTPVDDKAPTDIAPTKENIVDAPNADQGIADPMTTPMDAPIDPTLDLGATDPMAIDPMTTDPMVPDVDPTMDAPAVDPVTDDSDALGLDTDDAEIPADDGQTIDTPTDAPVDKPTTDTDTDTDVDDFNFDSDDIDVDDDDDEPSTDEQNVKLESIRENFFAAERQRKIDSIMESVMDDVNHAIEADKTTKVTAVLEGIAASLKTQKETEAQLEAIVKKVKAKSGVVEMPKKKVKPVTETIPVAEKAKKRSAKLESLIESYKQDQAAKKAKFEAISARKKAREILESITR